ncbi:hypothetical protein PIB30_016267 [Stylosanthes scabra]|uniref:Uncharacterized protein n=1 Tax=Stylosanthes scabra TaxID=79078 RepID=A0ABU6Z435_9FABA|nr:hypothetical protein [Stylosanthes scabra]
MGELGRKQISQMAYRLHVIIGRQSECQVLWLNSDKDIQLMFDYHDSNKKLRCIELYVKVEDVTSSASSKPSPQVVRSDNIGRGTKRVQSPVTPPSFAFPNHVENVEVVDGKRSNICASPANMASKGVAVDKLCLPPKTMNTGVPLVSLHLQLQRSLYLWTLESNVYSNHFQAKGTSRNLEPPITPNSQMVLEGRVKELEIRLESKENERAALEELKVTLTSKISNLENKLKEANKEKASQLRKERAASKGIIEPLEAEVKHLRCSVYDAKWIAHRNIMDQVRLLAPDINFSQVHPDHRVVNGKIVNPKDSVPQVTSFMQFGGRGKKHEMLLPYPTGAKEKTHGNMMEQE